MARSIIQMGERICGVSACEREEYCRGLCRLHYARTSRGVPLDQPVENHGQGPVRFCIVSGCGRERRARKYCDAHNRRVSRGQSLDEPLGWTYEAR